MSWWGLRPLSAVRIAMEHPIGALPCTPFASSRDFAPVGSMSLDFQVASLSYKFSSFATSRGNEKIGGTGYCVTYDTDSQSRNVLASPLGEEGHEVAKEWTVVILIMILDVDVTAAGGIIKLIAPKGETTHYILRVAGAPSTTAVTDSLDFQVADAPLQIQFA